jgi:hypothetical protein
MHLSQHISASPSHLVHELSHAEARLFLLNHFAVIFISHILYDF